MSESRRSSNARGLFSAIAENGRGHDPASVRALRLSWLSKIPPGVSGGVCGVSGKSDRCSVLRCLGEGGHVASRSLTRGFVLWQRRPVGVGAAAGVREFQNPVADLAVAAKPREAIGHRRRELTRRDGPVERTFVDDHPVRPTVAAVVTAVTGAGEESTMRMGIDVQVVALPGRFVTAEELERVSLITAVVADDAPDEATAALIESVSRSGGFAIRQV